MANLPWAAALAILGALLIIAPWTFAPVCEVHGSYVQTVSGKQLPMPCGYTARAEIGVGALLLVAGGVLAVTRSGEARRNVGIFGVALGALAMAFPIYLIGMCAMADHSCRTMTQPVLMLLGVATIAVSGAVIYRSRSAWESPDGDPASDARTG